MGNGFPDHNIIVDVISLHKVYYDKLCPMCFAARLFRVMWVMATSNI